MKKACSFFAILFLAAKLFAQTDEPIKLALISEADEVSAANDLLTAQLSSDSRIHLLERDEIDRIYREQGLSAANRDYLKMGRLLGADGLLLMQKINEGTNHFLNVRLIAIKPGVILTDEKFSWPVKDLSEWSSAFAKHLDLFFPKLTVLAKDAIPISVVNLRSAIQSDEAEETERQLKLLAIRRLSNERQIFVLERQKMELLGEEKNLNSDESAFWNGSYLLDGVVDQNGYSKDLITINARLTPPKGGTPLLFEVAGSRANFAEVINQLAAKIIDALKINSTIKEWNADDEAAQFLDEAKWALKWKAFDEAQAAAESAWALGKKDLDCASVRVRAYVNEIPIVEGTNEEHFQSMADYLSGKEDPHFVHVNDLPDPQNIDRSLYALESYYEFSRNSSDGVPKILSRGSGWNDWHDSDWYKLGIDALAAASQVLQHYYFNPQSQPPVAGKLADLRAVTRTVAELILQSPSVHDSYFIGDRIATRDELLHTIGENPNIFRCELNWGCFWQEQPEDTITLYCELMSAPPFVCIQGELWFRQSICPRLVSWNENAQKRIPTVWNRFLDELNNSTNYFFRMEAKALIYADKLNQMDADVDPDGNLFRQKGLAGIKQVKLERDEQLKNSWNTLFHFITSNCDRIIADNNELLNFGFGLSLFLDRERVLTPAIVELNERYGKEYAPELAALVEKSQQQISLRLKEKENRLVFEEQKQFLAGFKPYEFQKFDEIFSERNYSKAQATELKPLLEAYQSNLVAQAPENEKWKAKGDTNWINFFVGKEIEQILNPPAAGRGKIAAAQNFRPSTVTAVVSSKAAAKIFTPSMKIPTNILLVKNFIKIPYKQIQNEEISGNEIFAQRWSDGKFLVALEYARQIDKYDTNGYLIDAHNSSAYAIFNPADGNWSIVHCPETTNGSTREITMQNYNNHIIWFHGNLFSSTDGALKKFDFQKKEWSILEIPESGDCDLFSVAGHLYAANRNVIFEISDDEKTTHILASTRRRPVVSILDSLNDFSPLASSADGSPSSPKLFSGLDHSLCVSIGNKIYRWDGNDWREILTVNVSQPPEIFDKAVIFRSVSYFGSDDPSRLWIWKKDQSQPELALLDKPKSHPNIITSSFRKSNADDSNLHPFWQSLNNEFLTDAAMTFYQSNLYFFMDHATLTNINGQWSIKEKDGYHAKLICLSPDLPEPIVVPLKFDMEAGKPPLKINGEKSEPWLQFTPAVNTTMHFSENILFLNQRNVPGIWAIPLSEIEAAIVAQKQAQIVRRQQSADANKKNRQNLLTKYDSNQNGVIDPDEKATALDDFNFVESELDKIDINHNGWLDAEELIYFDANANKILESKEQAGIDIARHLFAERLLKRFDENGDGILDRSEFNNLWQSGNFGNNAPLSNPFLIFSASDENHNEVIDVGELEFLLTQQIQRKLRQRLIPGPDFFYQMRANASVPSNERQLFKVMVESYWQNHEAEAGGASKSQTQ